MGTRFQKPPVILRFNPNLLGKWKNQLAGGNHQTFPGKGYMAPEKEELQRLRMEHEILQRAVAFHYGAGLPGGSGIASSFERVWCSFELICSVEYFFCPATCDGHL